MSAVFNQVKKVGASVGRVPAKDRWKSRKTSFTKFDQTQMFWVYLVFVRFPTGFYVSVWWWKKKTQEEVNQWCVRHGHRPVFNEVDKFYG